MFETESFKSMNFLRSLIPGLLLLCSSLATQGSIVNYHATGQFTSSDFPLDIAIGDRFSIDFSYDDSVLDSNPNNFGNFAGALRSLDFRLLPGFSTGQYAGGHLTVPGEVETIDGNGPLVPDRFYARADFGTFPPLGGYAFSGLLFVLDDPTDTSSITDSGGNPTLASVLNGPVVLSQFSQTTVRLDAVDKHGSAQGVVTSLTVVPEPVSGALMIIGASMLILLDRRRISRR
jgi:hypothetical protein